MKRKTLSIIIPTYNRALLLEYTLSFFKEQIIRNRDNVELIVCNNASTDNTSAVLHEYRNDNPFFSIVEYSEHVDDGNVIIRPTENAKGVYFIVYGDDDIPMPYMVDTLLECVKQHPDAGYICFNRLRGNSCEANLGIGNIHLAGVQTIDEGVRIYKDITDLANEHQNEVGFISVNMIRTDLWKNRYRDVYPNNCRGYEFILPYLYSAKGKKCIYIQFPLCAQRSPSLTKKNAAPVWGDRSLLYFYLGRPRAIFAQEKYGIVNDAKSLFQSYERQFGYSFLLSHLISVPQASNEVFDCADEMVNYLSDEREMKLVRRLLSSCETKRTFYISVYRMQMKLRSGLRKIKNIINFW